MRARSAARLSIIVLLCTVVGWALTTVDSAWGAQAGPGWALTSRTFPTNLPPEGKGTIQVEILNVGKAPSSGPITITDTLPLGITATSAGELEGIRSEESTVNNELWNCTGNGPGADPKVLGATVVTCTNEPSGFVFAGGAGPSGGGVPDPNRQPELGINVTTGPNQGTETNHVTIGGGGALTTASVASDVTVSATPATFGFTDWTGWFTAEDGTFDTQAGSHPYEATFSFDFATSVNPKNHRLIAAGGEARNLVVDLPPGFVGNPNAVPQCTRQELDNVVCPNATQIGFALVFLGGENQLVDRVYNMVPPPGVPAEFGLITVEGINNYLDASVRSGSDYGITENIGNLPTGRQITHVVTTLWGVPSDPSHTIWRNSSQGGCSQQQLEQIGNSVQEEQNCKSVGEAPKPFLTLPTACGQAQPFTIRANSWQHPDIWAKAEFESHDSNGNPTGFTGCENLAFGPTITASPDTGNADTPTGLTFDVTPPLGGLENPEGLGTSDIKGTKVVLPPGLVINPGQAAGLQACQPGQDGLTTESEIAEGEENNGPPSCPAASKVGTVKAKSPLLEAAAEKELEGNVYVMQSNPPNLKLLAAFSADGVNIKLVLNTKLCESAGQSIEGTTCEAPGQIITTVANVPEFPVSDFKLSFSGGAQAALDTPPQCGSYTTTSVFSPWSSPFVADATPSSAFGITAGPGSGPCPSTPLPFSPSLIAGSTTDQAGAFTNFSLLLQRGDGQQRIEKLQFKEPAGAAGLISQVPLCPEPQASQGSCSAASHIGHAVVTSGPGPYPLVIPQPGEPEAPIYLTGPYKGAPFGLSIVTPVIAGPFNLGTIITRAKIEVDPHTAQITITTDPLPQIVDGVPTDLRSVNSIIDRPNFLFNPTNCTSQEFAGTATSAGGAATAPISSHFGVSSCQSLKFAPKVAVTTGAKSSKANGASLLFKISYPAGAMGTQSWFNEAKFDIPKQLPARLTTIQKACLASVFETNPAACPPASLIGHAVVHTQVLPVPLAGPVYFVSHGGAKFPDAVLVLQGDGVTVDLVGETFINGKTNVTSATFRNTPDVPFESIEVTVPSGPFSEFGANLPAKAKGSFCGQKLVMPTLFKAQNGLEINQNTSVSVSGCAKPKALTRAQKLAKAMKACKKKPKRKRAACAKQARKKYGARSKKTKKK